jgi:hypothetical protein
MYMGMSLLKLEKAGGGVTIYLCVKARVHGYSVHTID